MIPLSLLAVTCGVAVVTVRNGFICMHTGILSLRAGTLLVKIAPRGQSSASRPVSQGDRSEQVTRQVNVRASEMCFTFSFFSPIISFLPLFPLIWVLM